MLLVTNKHHFVDGPLLYQFRMNFRRRRRLMELLHERGRRIPESHDSPFCLRKQSSDGGNTSFLSGTHPTPLSVAAGKLCFIISSLIPDFYSWNSELIDQLNNQQIQTFAHSRSFCGSFCRPFGGDLGELFAFHRKLSLFPCVHEALLLSNSLNIAPGYWSQ